MQKLYYDNPYLKEFTAEITAVIEKDNTFHIELNETCFYPEGGGQPSDAGFIEASPISYVYENEGHIYHVSSVKPHKIHRVKCTLDWQRRFDHMQQHLGQHILSACLSDLFSSHTIGFHLGEHYSTIDLDCQLNNEQLLQTESLANQMVFDRIPVEVLYPSKSELKKLSVKKSLPKMNDPLRLVKIGDLDLNPCCGTHPSSTLEVQGIKIIKHEKYKTGIRIYFVCGKRALQDYFAKDAFTSSLCMMLKCSKEDVLQKITKLTGDINKLSAENRNLKAEITSYESSHMLNAAEIIHSIRVIHKVYEKGDLKSLSLLAAKLTEHEKVIVLFGIQAEDTAHLIFMCSKELKKVHMGNLLKDAITLLDGKGGGSSFSAQGGGKSANNLSSSIDYAFMKVQHLLGI